MGTRKKRWFADGLKFECTGCGDCCKFAEGFVAVSPLEIDQISHYLNISYKQFVEVYTRKHQNIFVLKDKDNACIFLEDNLCKIYPVRPMQCSTYPFWITNLKSQYRWKIVAEQCEGVGEGKLYTYDEINSIRNDSKQTNPGKLEKGD